MDVNIGLRLKVLRERAGLSQEELSRRLGYSSKSSINKIETGCSGIPSHKLKRFCDALGCELEELVNVNELPVIKTYNELQAQKTQEYLDDVERFAALQNILEMLAHMDAKEIVKVEKVIRTLSEG